MRTVHDRRKEWGLRLAFAVFLVLVVFFGVNLLRRILFSPMAYSVECVEEELIVELPPLEYQEA